MSFLLDLLEPEYWFIACMYILFSKSVHIASARNPWFIPLLCVCSENKGSIISQIPSQWPDFADSMFVVRDAYEQSQPGGSKRKSFPFVLHSKVRGFPKISPLNTKGNDKGPESFKATFTEKHLSLIEKS